MAVITFSLSLTKTIEFSSNVVQIDIAGIIFGLEFGLGTIIAFFTALLTAAGSIWLIMNHPRFVSSGNKWYKALSHMIIPVMSAFIISITLSNMNKGSAWWILLGLSIFLLTMVLIAEYNIFDPSGQIHPLAAISLISLTFALFLVLTITLRTSDVRLTFVIPLISIAGSLAAARFLYLQASGKWLVEWVIIIAFIISQIVIGLHYLNIRPIPYALILFGVLLGLSQLFLGLFKKKRGLSLLAEPLLMIIIVGILVGYFW